MGIVLYYFLCRSDVVIFGFKRGFRMCLILGVIVFVFVLGVFVFVVGMVLVDDVCGKVCYVGDGIVILGDGMCYKLFEGLNFFELKEG